MHSTVWRGWMVAGALTVALGVFAPDGSAVSLRPGASANDPHSRAAGGTGPRVLGLRSSLPLVEFSEGRTVEELASLASPCVDVVFFGARGSGETPRDHPFQMGDTVGAVFTEWVGQISDRRVAYWPVNYPAHSVPYMATNTKKYFEGLTHGVEDVQKSIETRAAKCPLERYVLAGYSQGSMVVHRALWVSDLNLKRSVVGVVLVADGDRVRGEGSLNPGTARSSNGVTWSVPNLKGSRRGAEKRRLPGWAKSRWHSVCDKNDPVCDTRLPRSCGKSATWSALACALRVRKLLKIHTSYATDHAVTSAARAIGKRTMRFTKANPPMTFDVRFPDLPREGETFGMQLNATGGAAPYTYGLVKSSLPGVSVSRAGFLKGFIPSGFRDNGAQSFTLKIRATDFNGQVLVNDGEYRFHLSAIPDPTPPPPDPGRTRLVSAASDGTPADAHSDNPETSGNGRYVVYESSAANLVGGDINHQGDVFSWDRNTGQTTLVSITASGTSGNGWSSGPSISDDGRFVTYHSSASNLVQDDRNGKTDVFVWDRRDGRTTLVSAYEGPSPDTRGSDQPSISDDGRHIAYQSYVSSLVSGDTNGERDVFVWDRQTGHATLVSAPPAGAPANGESNSPTISNDGRYVTYSSSATNLVNDDLNGQSDVFISDLQTGETIQVSKSAAGLPGNGGSGRADVSSDGRFVAYHSHASNLVPDDENDQLDVFVWERESRHVALISRSVGGEPGTGDSHSPALSTDGRYVVYASFARNLADTSRGSNILLLDRQTGQTSLITPATSGQSPNGASGPSSVSEDGRFVSYLSEAQDLVPGETIPGLNIYSWENPFVRPTP